MSASPTYLDRIALDVARRMEERKLDAGAGKRVVKAHMERPSFAAAVATTGMCVIAEVKRRSPSKGPIRPDLDVGEIVSAYQRGGARAISVLTERDHFGGSLTDLETAFERCGLPILQKDFFLDPFQVHEAQGHGASAILLIAALLDDDRLRDLIGLARNLGLDVLLEVHDEHEMSRALAFDGVIIGINNRDLRSFSVSLETTVKLSRLVPDDRLLVAESGIRTRADVELMVTSGVNGLLVGEGLLREPDVETAVKNLISNDPGWGRPSCPRSTRVGKEES